MTDLRRLAEEAKAYPEKLPAGRRAYTCQGCGSAGASSDDPARCWYCHSTEHTIFAVDQTSSAQVMRYY